MATTKETETKKAADKKAKTDKKVAEDKKVAADKKVADDKVAVDKKAETDKKVAEDKKAKTKPSASEGAKKSAQEDINIPHLTAPTTASEANAQKLGEVSPGTESPKATPAPVVDPATTGDASKSLNANVLGDQTAANAAMSSPEEVKAASSGAAGTVKTTEATARPTALEVSELGNAGTGQTPVQTASVAVLNGATAQDLQSQLDFERSENKRLTTFLVERKLMKGGDNLVDKAIEAMGNKIRLEVLDGERVQIEDAPKEKKGDQPGRTLAKGTSLMFGNTKVTLGDDTLVHYNGDQDEGMFAGMIAGTENDYLNRGSLQHRYDGFGTRLPLAEQVDSEEELPGFIAGLDEEESRKFGLSREAWESHQKQSSAKKETAEADKKDK